ncbi:hypothetical protein DCPSUM001_03490 [Dysgonomonas capnocytophagoides]|nr:hypothetical protein DCPSUM001_03490 [Dysgonomonas capnocytophagoides]
MPSAAYLLQNKKITSIKKKNNGTQAEQFLQENDGALRRRADRTKVVVEDVYATGMERRW